MSDATESPVNQACRLALAWLDTASPSELWQVIQAGDLAQRAGADGIPHGTGALAGIGPTFFDELRVREWADPAAAFVEARNMEGLAGWFTADAAAVAAAREEVRRQIAEYFADCGDYWISEVGQPATWSPGEDEV